MGELDKRNSEKTDSEVRLGRERLKAATLAADRAEYRRTTIGQRVEQAMILSKELGELAARRLKRSSDEQAT